MSVFSLKIVLSRRVPRTLILLLVLMLAVTMSAGVSTVQAYANYDYDDNGDGTCTIYFYDGTEDVVDIPSTLGGLTVTAISGYAFHNSLLKSVTIPNSVTSIGNSAFAGCSGLTSVTIPGSVTSIGNGAFSDCSALTGITIPSGITSISEGTFASCNALTSVTIPDGVASIGSSAFLECTSMASITIPDSVTSIGNNAFDSCIQLTSITIPSSVTSIGNSAFRGCSGLTSVTIPSSVTSIGNMVFYGCRGLTDVSIPDGVTSIGDYAYAECDGLTSVTIPGSVTSIGDSAFRYCSALTSVTLPNSVQSIGDSAFSDCRAMTSVTLSSKINSIGNSVFADCFALTGITIPSSVTSIGDLAFYSSGLTSVTIPSSVTSIGASAFSYCSELTSVTIPDSVTSISSGVFGSCVKLAGVSIPSNVTSIGPYAFAWCSGLTSITIPNSVTSIGDAAFKRCTGLTSVTIPKSVIYIEEDAFAFCDALTSVYFDGVTPFMAGAFIGSGTRTYYCPEGNPGGIYLTPLTQVATKTITVSAVSCNYITPSTYSGMPGETISLKITPPSGYVLQPGSLKYNDGSDHPISGTSVIMPDSNITISAVFKVNGADGGSGSGAGSGSSSGGGRTTPAAPTYHAEVNTGSSSDSTLAVTIDKKSGNASVDLSSEAGLLSDGKETVITVPTVPDIDTYTLGISVSDLSTAGRKGTLTFKTGTGTVTAPSNMLAGIGGISGRKVEISIGQGDKNRLPEDVRDAIGSRPLVQLTLSIEGKQTDWNNPDAPATVSIPYSPTAEELANQESIAIWYIDGSGNTVSVPSGRYDAVTGTVTFTTTHFSDYAVVYNKMSFNDVAKSAWYYKAVSFIAARDITTGTGNGNFSPKARLTRGEFIVMLMKAYGIAPDSNSTDNFSDAGSAYYTGYLAAAKEAGISDGIGGNLFAPKKQITRQEMFALIYNALNVIGQLPESDSGKALSDFTDVGQIDSWAKDAVMRLVETETIGGNAGKLALTSTTTRAEMAQVLYNLVEK